VLSEVSSELKALQEFGARSLTGTKRDPSEAALDWRINREAVNDDLGEATGTNGPAVRSVARPGVAKIHARLLSESEAEAQARAPSSASEGWRA